MGPIGGSCAPVNGGQIELWVLIVEKALAKIYGGYGFFGATGRSEDIMNTLSGGLVSRLVFRTQADCWYVDQVFCAVLFKTCASGRV